MVKISPSILSADFTRLGEQIKEAEEAGADYIHVDVMDGHFVPNITIGPLICAAARRSTQLPLDVHLMIEAPEKYIDDFAKAGATIIIVHVETCPHLHRTVQQIKDSGCKAGVVINPATPLIVLQEILPCVDQVLLMTVNPGFGGQSFIETGLSKIATLRQYRDANRFTFDIEVDGGVSPHTVGDVTAAGATVLVAGSAVFGQGVVKENIAILRSGIRPSTPSAYLSAQSSTFFLT